MESFVHKVADLPEATRSAVESLTGHRLRDDQQVCVVTLDPAREPSAKERFDAWRDLQQSIAEMHARVLQSGVATDEIDRIIDEACEEVRYGKKPCE